MMNMLLGGVCILIPIVGILVLMGWLITGFWAREDERFETFPDFDFGKFGKYLERGLWPFLVTLVASLPLLAVMFVLMIPIMLIGALFSGDGGDGNGLAGAIIAILMIGFYFLMMIVLALVMAPLTLRASLTQDFAKSFNIAFVRRFISLTWKEIILSWLFLMVVSIGFSVIGLLAFCIGAYFAFVPSYFAWAHLNKQIYRLYLSRGGEPVPRSPKLQDDPPPLPVT